MKLKYVRRLHGELHNGVYRIIVSSAVSREDEDANV